MTRMTLHGSINHVALTVSDLDSAMAFLRPLLEFFGYAVGEVAEYAGTRLAVNLNPMTGTGINIWEAKRRHAFDVYEPGLHHIAINAGSKADVDEAHRLAVQLGAKILDGPAEFPFATGGYFALYFLGPDDIKFEVVHMPELAARHGVKIDGDLA